MSDMYNDAQQAMEDAESFGIRRNFGQLTISAPRYIHWVDGSPVDVTAEQWRQLGSRDKSMELTFSVNIQEFNPELGFQYERRVAFKSLDWKRIVQPSMEKVFGKKFQLAALSGLYVEIEDVPQIKDDEYNTIKFIRAFAGRDEAFAAYNAFYNSGQAASVAPVATTAAPVPPTPGATVDFPADVYGDLNVWKTVVTGIKGELAQNKPLPEIASTYGIDVSWVAKVQAGAYD